MCETLLGEVFFFLSNGVRKLVDGTVLMWELLLLQSPVTVPENLLMFCWHVVDDVNDRLVGNPKRRCDEHISKFFLSYETKVYQSSRKKPNSRR
jgi:hypothetical protein